ncbi:EscF/YscF/HrpA family type III secretion system needle major subunit [Acidovorax sp.]|uniref:EscF/YscF/HrpA family type III secretion system needle major subunit n=1 Tax=Acidovorax sp. TaxID=1872122 RepID=UPI00391F142A
MAGINFNNLHNTLGKVSQTREAELQSTITSMDDSATTTDLLKLQQQIQQWTMFTQIQSTVV